MKHWIKTTLGIGLAIGLWQVSADARFLDLKKQENVPATPAPIPQTNTITTPPSTSYNSEVAPKSISLRFENLSLISVLQNIQEETGILFSIDPAMETVPFSATTQADNWEATVRELLKGFSRVEVWTDNLQTSRVWVMSGEEVQPDNRNADIRLSRQAPTQQPRTQKKPGFRVAPTPAPVTNASLRIEDLPPHILFEPGVLTFFKSKGIALPQNVKNMFGPNLEGLPANMPISPHILTDPTFTGFLQSKGISTPQS
ncbi:MAG TPA: hypothetical protein HPP54_09180 [Nitrospinae bacterium]|jgi:hypothetical protein|nr:hypothetical protein [Nitrospinota bacterium]